MNVYIGVPNKEGKLVVTVVNSGNRSGMRRAIFAVYILPQNQLRKLTQTGTR